MIILLTGGCKNGKSGIAQKLAVLLARRGQRQLYYVATMRSTGPEDDERIRRHVKDRAGLGFNTIELKEKISTLLIEAGNYGEGNAAQSCGHGTFLIDSTTALLANEMFRENEEGLFFTDKDAAVRVAAELEALIKSALENDDDLIFVSDGIYSDAAVYEGDTFLYREALGMLERTVSKDADLVIEMCAGVPVIHKEGSGLTEDKELMDQLNRVIDKKGALIIGGAAQGKRAYVKRELGITDEDIYTFDANDIMDGNIGVPGGFKVYDHVERLALSEGKDEHELADLFPDDAVLICEDITCGIVPMSKEDRRWRDDAGRLMQALGAGREVVRVFCGKGTRIG